MAPELQQGEPSYAEYRQQPVDLLLGACVCHNAEECAFCCRGTICTWSAGVRLASHRDDA